MFLEKVKFLLPPGASPLKANNLFNQHLLCLSSLLHLQFICDIEPSEANMNIISFNVLLLHLLDLPVHPLPRVPHHLFRNFWPPNIGW